MQKSWQLLLSMLFTFQNKSYNISPQIRYIRSHTYSAPRESSKLDLSIPQIKVMWKLCCQTGWPIFSLLGIFFLSFCSLSLSISPPLSLFLYLYLFLSSFLIFLPLSVSQKAPHLLARHAEMMIILFGKNKAQTRALDLDGQWAVLILFWEHVGVPGASALPLPRTCHLAGGLPLLRTAQEDNEHNEISPASCSGYTAQGVSLFRGLSLWSLKHAFVFECLFYFQMAVTN